jgi:hypothetical protein
MKLLTRRLLRNAPARAAGWPRVRLSRPRPPQLIPSLVHGAAVPRARSGHEKGPTESAGPRAEVSPEEPRQVRWRVVAWIAPPPPRRPPRLAFSAHDSQYPQVASLGDECFSPCQHFPFCWIGPPKIPSAEAGAAESRAAVAASIVNCRMVPLLGWFL